MGGRVEGGRVRVGDGFSRFGVGIAGLRHDVTFCRGTLKLGRRREGRSSSNSFALICLASNDANFLLRLAYLGRRPRTCRLKRGRDRLYFHMSNGCSTVHRCRGRGK